MVQTIALSDHIEPFPVTCDKEAQKVAVDSTL